MRGVAKVSFSLIPDFGPLRELPGDPGDLGFGGCGPLKDSNRRPRGGPRGAPPPIRPCTPNGPLGPSGGLYYVIILLYCYIVILLYY